MFFSLEEAKGSWIIYYLIKDTCFKIGFVKRKKKDNEDKPEMNKWYEYKRIKNENICTTIDMLQFTAC